MKQTPLCESHEALGGKMVEFAGWRMPVEYQGLRQEHLNTRKNVGLFDVSHMGEIRVRGPKALDTLEWVTSNHVGKLENGQAQYSLLTNYEGGIVDDLIVYCLEKGQDYLLCVNASNTDKDFAWVVKNNRGAEVTNESDDWGQIAVQGPRAIELVSRLFGERVKAVASFHFIPADFDGSQVYLARTGYTGEEGFEIFVPADRAAALWNLLLDKGQDLEVCPVGLGARDTLRTEMKYPLYGHEIDDTTNPYQAGLGWVVKPTAKDFIGRDKIVAGKEAGLSQKLVGLKMLDRGIARQGYSLFSFDNKEIGKVTSGTVSPSLGENIAVGYLAKELAEPGTEVMVEIRGRKLKAVVVKTPFVTKA
ncbi:MAG: glycine cleavage system aminomethyltransferase GcvT [Bdellovibrionales bacterium]|nr:glycine cleavage system aminomethyltransferase GcvT [Bdellovibrionales bacterium]